MVLGSDEVTTSTCFQSIIVITDVQRRLVANLVVSGHYAKQCLDFIAAAEARAIANLHFARWLCHYRLFGVGAIVSGPTYDAQFIGHHVKVCGDADYLVPKGTYVHVEDGQVYSNERFLAEYLTGSDAKDEDSIVMSGEMGRYEIGKIDTNVKLPNNHSAIIWGMYYADVYGCDDDEIDDDASYPDGFDRLFCDIVILGSSGVYHYDEWDQLYSPLKSRIVNRA